MIKRLCALALAVMLLLSITMAAFAEPPSEELPPEPPTGQVFIITVQPYYTVYDDGIACDETP